MSKVNAIHHGKWQAGLVVIYGNDDKGKRREMALARDEATATQIAHDHNLAALVPELTTVLREELNALYVWQNAIHPKSDIQEGIAISIDKIRAVLAAFTDEQRVKEA